MNRILKCTPNGDEVLGEKTPSVKTNKKFYCKHCGEEISKMRLLLLIRCENLEPKDWFCTKCFYKD